MRILLPRTALAAIGLVLPVLAAAACKLEALQLPVKMVGSRAVATVGINGTPVPLTVDSGAFFSFLTDAAAAQLALPTTSAPWLRVEGVAGRVETRLTTVEKLELLKGDIPKVQFIVGGNEPGAGTMGLMGRNLLSLYDTEYDIGNGAIRFVAPSDGCDDTNMAYWAGNTPVTEADLITERRDKTPAIRVRVKLNGTTIVALLDTGAGTVISSRAARKAGVAEEQMEPAGMVYGAGRGSVKAWTARFDKFELGGESIANNRFRVADLSMREADMLLGIDFFLSHRIYISKAQSKMYVTYNGGTVFALNRSEAGAVPSEADAAASAADAATGDQLARRGAALASRGEHARALADLDRAVALEPQSAAHFAQRGTILEALKRPAKAMEDFDKALELDPSLADARFQRALLRLGARNRAGANADLAELDKTLAPQAQMRLPMANLYSSLEQPAQSLAQLNRWLPSHPSEFRRHSALNSRCWMRARLGIELEKAIEDCDEAIDSDSKNAGYFDTRGWAYLRLGNHKKALADFDRSIELRPAGAWSLYGRSLTKARLGDAAASEADLAAARKAQADIDTRVAQAGMPTAAARP